MSECTSCRLEVVCHTEFGERVCAVGNTPELGSWDPSKAVPLTTTSETYPTWSCDITVPPIRAEFKLVVVKPCGRVQWEHFEGNRLLPESGELNDLFGLVVCADYSDPAIHIRSAAVKAPTESNAIKVSVGDKGPTEIRGDQGTNSFKGSYCVQLVCHTQFGESLYAVGSAHELGSWNLEKAVPLRTDAEAYPAWSMQTSLSAMGSQLKFVIRKLGGHMQWESFEGNRTLPEVLPLGGSDVLVSSTFSDPVMRIEIGRDEAMAVPETAVANVAAEATAAEGKTTADAKAVAEAKAIADDKAKAVEAQAAVLAKAATEARAAAEVNAAAGANAVAETKMVADAIGRARGVARDDSSISTCLMGSEDSEKEDEAPITILWRLNSAAVKTKSGKPTLQLSRRRSTNMDDRVPVKDCCAVTSGAIVRGSLVESAVGAKWVHCTDGYFLPCKIDGVSILFPVVDNIPDDAMQKVISESVDLFVYGKHAEEQDAHIDREMVFCQGGELPAGFPAIKCTKGYKGKHDAPNQDNVSVTYCKSGHTIICVMDGHGAHGEHASTHAIKLLPYFLMNSHHFPSDMVHAVEDAFLKTQDDMVAAAEAGGWSSYISGTTALVAVIQGTTVWAATAGDSRMVMGSVLSRKVLFETVDHKPLDEEESKRIYEHGGEVKSHDDIGRVFLSGSDLLPGISMSRSLGDCICKPDIITASPTVVEWDADLSQMPFIFMASDGIWEFMSSEHVVEEIAKNINSEGQHKCVARLSQEALKLWQWHEPAYVDDITGVLLMFPKPESESRP